MKQAKQCLLGVAATSLLLTGAGAFAEPMDGARILEMEAEKARQIEDLEYQAKLVEQKAKLAKAYQQLRESGGVIPGEEGIEFSADNANRSSPAAGSADINLLPTLKSIGNGYAVFEHQGKVFRAAPGGSLPGGFTVISVSDAQGVRLKQGASVYALDIAWVPSGK